MNIKCKKCGCANLAVKVVKMHTGIYCTQCGAFIKWANKDEARAIALQNETYVEIKIKYLRDIPQLRPFAVGDWIDLYTGEDVFIKQGEYTNIPLGIAVQLPVGYEAIIAPRSSTFKRYGIIQTNGIGIIDESYNGDGDEWCLPVYALKSDIFIPKGARICQFRLFKHQLPCLFGEVSILGNKNRGGFGGTGV